MTKLKLAYKEKQKNTFMYPDKSLSIELCTGKGVLLSNGGRGGAGH